MSGCVVRAQAASLFQGKDSILSGPAGGIVGAAVTSEAENFSNIIGFDMGGTSTDVAHYNGELRITWYFAGACEIPPSTTCGHSKNGLSGEYERTFNTEVAGVRMRAPMMRIHTVAVRQLALYCSACARLHLFCCFLSAGWWRFYSFFRWHTHEGWACISWCEPWTGTTRAQSG